MSNVKTLNKEKIYTKEGELMERLTHLIDEYAGELSLVAVMGILELKKITMVDD
tara:strand:- start:671 stop:832 length:162 start_codon:yes stop_codon:yes gene_type:complete